MTVLKVCGLTFTVKCVASIYRTQMAFYQVQRPISHARSADWSQAHGSYLCVDLVLLVCPGLRTKIVNVLLIMQTELFNSC